MKLVKKEKHTPKHYLPDTTPKIAAAGATVLVLLVVLSFVLSSGWMHGSSTGIILPGSEGDSPTVGTGSALLTGQSVDDITIDVNNAKTVIATLTRPAAYSSRIENTIYYDGGSAALYCHRYVRDNVMRTDTLGSDNQVQSTLIRVPDSKVYAWNAGDSIAYQGKAGDFTDDAAAMLPTYEDVLADEVQLTAPGIGGECGCTMGQNRLLYQGLFMAPHVTMQAVKTAMFCAKVMEKLGYEVSPKAEEPRYDIIQTIAFGAPDPLRRFCEGIQAGAPVDSYVTPEPWAMPGYDDQVIMAAGAFVQGASIELSADAPMREPYVCYMQGGLTYESGKLGILLAADKITKAKAQ